MQAPETEILFDHDAMLAAFRRQVNGEEAALETPETDIPYVPYDSMPYVEDEVPEAENPETEVPFDRDAVLAALRRQLNGEE
jgi:hypothetical protein